MIDQLVSLVRPGSKYTWRFFRAGGFDQVRLDKGADLAALDQLDQKLWVALSCPSRGLEFDTKTLDLIDSDKDGRIRVPEILAAVKWAVSMLKSPDELINGAGAASMPLSVINDTVPEGKHLLGAARHILTNLGKADATTITIEDTADTVKIFAQTKLNGDGIITEDSTDDAAIKALIVEIISCVGSEPDRSGKLGISQAKIDQFFTEAQAHFDWWKKAEQDAVNVLPLGDATHAAAAALKAVRAKVDDFFTRTRLATFDPRALTAVNRVETDYLALGTKDLSATGAEVAGFPLAHIEPGRPLPLESGLNPSWAAAMAEFNTSTVKPLLGDRTELMTEVWSALNARFAPYEAWQAVKAGVLVEKLGILRVSESLAGNGKTALTSLIEQDKALEGEFNSMASVERLVRYYRDLYNLLNNFVAFRDFYQRTGKAVFQAGTLYLDQRSCDLCLRVDEPGRHALMAGLAGTYLAYCDCVRKATGEKMQIVAAFTDGDSDNLMAGRNGIFYDRQGRDWDATITRIIDNPISVRQAFFSPYKKLVRLIEEQFAKRAAAAETASNAKLDLAAQAVTNVDKAKAAEPKKVDVGTVAALGVAFGAIGTLLSELIGRATGILNGGVLSVITAILGIILLISGPSMLIAFIKLRKRNLGPILDANGWAVNAKALINVAFGASLTQVAEIPLGSPRDLVDPFAEKKNRWPLVITILLLILYILYQLLPLYGSIKVWINSF